MLVQDDVLEKYFETLTDSAMPHNMKPRDAKLLLAETIIGMYHGEKMGVKTKDAWIKKFSKKEINSRDLPPLNVGIVLNWMPDDLVLKSGVVKSRSAAWRLIKQGGFEVRGEKIKDPHPPGGIVFSVGDVVKIGKKDFFRIEH